MIEIIIESDELRNLPYVKRALIFSYDEGTNLPEIDGFILDELGWQELLAVLTKAQERAKAK